MWNIINIYNDISSGQTSILATKMPACEDLHSALMLCVEEQHCYIPVMLRRRGRKRFQKAHIWFLRPLWTFIGSVLSPTCFCSLTVNRGQRFLLSASPSWFTLGFLREEDEKQVPETVKQGIKNRLLKCKVCTTSPSNFVRHSRTL